MQLNEINLSCHNVDWHPFFIIILTLVAFITYWFVAASSGIRKQFFSKQTNDRASVRHITFSRLFGFLVLGVIPAILCLMFLPGFTLQDVGFAFNPGKWLFSITWIAGLSLVVLPFAYFTANNPGRLAQYPQIRTRIWTWQTVLTNIMGWTLYLLGYEFLFRGILLFPLVAEIGVWNAVAINVALYSATHIPKGLGETLGAIPLGFLFCVLTLASGMIWIAFAVHLAMALSNSFSALKFHPEMHFRRLDR